MPSRSGRSCRRDRWRRSAGLRSVMTCASVVAANGGRAPARRRRHARDRNSIIFGEDGRRERQRVRRPMAAERPNTARSRARRRRCGRCRSTVSGRRKAEARQRDAEGEREIVTRSFPWRRSSRSARATAGAATGEAGASRCRASATRRLNRFSGSWGGSRFRRSHGVRQGTAWHGRRERQRARRSTVPDGRARRAAPATVPEGRYRLETLGRTGNGNDKARRTRASLRSWSRCRMRGRSPRASASRVTGDSGEAGHGNSASAARSAGDADVAAAPRPARRAAEARARCRRRARDTRTQ